jgi:hypothetical protein
MGSPRSRLPDIVEVILSVGARHGLRIANLMHAGDGNIHPLILYDDRDSEEVRRVVAAGNEILEACVAMGGSVTGEHGIGVEKVGLMRTSFTVDELRAMADVATCSIHASVIRTRCSVEPCLHRGYRPRPRARLKMNGMDEILPSTPAMTGNS